MLLPTIYTVPQHARISYSYLTLLWNPPDPSIPATLSSPCCHFRDQRNSSKLSQRLGLLPRGKAAQMTTLKESSIVHICSLLMDIMLGEGAHHSGMSVRSEIQSWEIQEEKNYGPVRNIRSWMFLNLGFFRNEIN